MTDEGEATASRAPEPELPARVPENDKPLTPDLPPLGVSAPDLWEAEGGDGPREEPQDKAGGAAEPKDPKPQEPTD
ncbi:hypothetical protein [Streptomyces sp. NPDC001568]|uniref:hypothetical protein n=1 Tax=Streptomyces sp. NPDC001568 TaxID=3364588 RepID=UPI00369B9C94